MTSETYSIGDLARVTGIKVVTIRYYERIGLLPPPARTGGNYRAYVKPHLERLSFIRRGRDLGFSLAAVRELLRLSDDRQQPCGEIDQVARIHLAEVEGKIADLTALRGELRQLIEQCRHGTVAECRIIEALVPHAEFKTFGLSGRYDRNWGAATASAPRGAAQIPERGAARSVTANR